MIGERVGLIGVGLLGTALAERLLASGRAVVGFDLRPECREALAAAGGEPASSAGEVVARCRRTVLSLPDSDAVERVLGEVLDHLAPGGVLLDTTTGDPERTARAGERLAMQDVAYLDACVLGSSAQVRAGEAIGMVGGRAIEENADLLGILVPRWVHAGDWGAGARLKLVVNLVLGLHRAVLAEGLAFARECGIDPAKALEVLRAGAAYSRVMDAKGEKMLTRDFRAQARLSQHLKDVRLILEQAARKDVRVPLTEVHRQLLEQVVALGGGDEDNSAVVRAYDR